MSTRVGEIFADLSLDTSAFETAVRQSERNFNGLRQAADRSMQGVRQGGEQAASGLNSVSNAAERAGRAQQAAGDQAAQAARQQIQALERLQAETRRYGTQAETAQERARVAVESRTIAERNLREVQQRGSATADEISAAERRLETARRDVIRTTDRAQSSADRLAASQRRTAQVADTVTDATRRAARQTENVGNSARDAEQDMRRLGRASEEAAQQTNNIGEGLQERMGGALEGIGGLAESAGGSAGGGFLGSFGGRVASLGSKAGPIGMALAGIAAVGLAAGAVLADAIADGMKQEQNLDLIQAQLGINEETTRRIGSAAGMSFSSGWGESVESNMATVKMAIQNGLLSGEEDTSMFKASIDDLNILSQKLGGEVEDSVKAVGSLVTSGLAKDWQEAANMIAKASDGTTNKAGDLAESVWEYSAGWKEAGFSAEFSLGLIRQATDAGAWNSDAPADAIREFGRRISEEGDTMKEVFSGLGFDAEQMYATFKEGGPEAEAAFDRVFDKIRDMPDGKDKADAIRNLLGDISGDFMAAYEQWDPSRAVSAFGDATGAIKEAGDTMSSNAASSFEAAKNSISVSADSIKLALADAFGPAMTQVATWVSEHKPEIIGFFTELATGALTCLDGMMAFSSGALRAWAFFAEGVGGTIGTIVQQLAGLIDAQASVLDLIPGMGGQADDFRGIADGMRGFAESVGTAGDKARGMADVIDEGRPIIQGMRDDVGAAGQAAQNSELMMRALGEGVNAIPDGKNINITDSTPEAQQRLRDLGLTVTTLPDGTVDVSANTAEGQAIIDAWIHQPRNTDVLVTPVINQQAWANAQRTFNQSGQQGPVAPIFKADGGVVNFANGTENHTAQIAAPGAWRVWAEPETGGEAYIPLAQGKRGRSISILGDVAERFGMALVKRETGNIFRGDPKSLTDETDPTGWRALLGGDYNGKLSKLGIEEDHPLVDAVLSGRKVINDGDYDGSLSKYGIEEDSPLVSALLGMHKMSSFADGGVVEGMTDFVSGISPGMQMTSGARDSADYHGQGLAADFSNGSANTDEMLALANAIADRYPDSLELIYSDPRFDRNMKDGKVVDPSFYGADTMAEHQNHVHWARKQAPSAADEKMFNPEGTPPPDTRTEKQKIADAIVAEGKRRGISDKGIKTALATGLAESDLANIDHGPDSSTGVFQQQDNGAWGTAEERMDPTKSSGMFYDQLQKLDYENMSEAEAAQAVQKSAFSDGSNYAAKLGEADALLAESYARSAPTAPAPGSDEKPAQSGTGQAVYVTNWPSSFASGSSSGSSTSSKSGTSTPSAPPPAKAEANTDSHDISTAGGRATLAAAIGAKFLADGGIEDHTAQIANAGDMRIFAEPETGGEAYIPMGASKRGRSVGILQQVAGRFGYALTAYAGGGFGGVSGANDHTAGSWKAISGARNAPSSLATPLRDTRLLKARDQAQQLAGFAVGSALAVASGFDGDGNFTGNFNTSNTSIPGLDKVLEELAKKIQPQPAVNIEHAEITADDPKDLVDQAMDPSRMPFMQTGI
jgi:hypothetical protein